MTLTVPTGLLVLPILGALVVAWIRILMWAWDRYLDPIFERWLYRRYCADLRRIGVEEPAFEVFVERAGSETNRGDAVNLQRETP